MAQVASLWGVIRFAGHEPLEGFDVPSKVWKNDLIGFLHQIVEIGTDSFVRILGLK